MNVVLITALKAALKLETAGHRAIVVGGAIRDTLLCREVRDADIATSATMDDIVSLWPCCKVIGTPPLATALLVVEGVKLDIASFQGRDPTEDLGRRDLTINAMGMAPDGEIIDPWGGSADMSSCLLRFTRDPIARLEEDPLRALRLARFASVLPHFTIDPSSAAACPGFSTALASIPLLRTGREILFALDGDLSLFLDALETLGILEAVLPFLAAPGAPERQNISRRVRLAGKLTSDPGLRSAALLADTVEKGNGIAASWGWPRSLATDIGNLGRRLSLTRERIDPVLFGHLFRTMGPEWIDRLFLLGLIDCLSGHRERMKTLTSNRAKASEYSFRLAALANLLNGEDIMRLAGIGSCPLVGAAVSAVHGAIAEGFVKDRKSALEFAAEWIEENRNKTVL